MNHYSSQPTNPSRSGAWRRIAAASLAFLLSWSQASVVLAAPAQVPLLTRSQSAVQPNVVFTFDDSGSMAWRFMPDATNISTTNSIRWKTTFHPDDTLTFGNGGSSTTYVLAARPNVRSSNHTLCTPDTQYADCAASDLVAARMRSSAYNALYYNPEIRYQPWYYSDGSQFPNSPPSAAWLDPTNHGAGTVNLVGNQTFPDNTTWCRSDDDDEANTTTAPDRNYANPDQDTCATLSPVASSESYTVDENTCNTIGNGWSWYSSANACGRNANNRNSCENAGGSWGSSSSNPRCRLQSINSSICSTLDGVWQNSSCRKAIREELAPAVYYLHNGGSLDDSYSYKRVRIMDLPATGISRGAARTDCSAGGCTREQEYQNFANWFTYYRTRNYLSIAAASKAFSKQGDELRVGYGRINRSSNTVDGVSTETLQRGVRTFSGADRTSFFSWLHSVPASGGTPLRRAMDDIGKYYQRNDNRGPWGNTPGTDDGGPATSHLQCRKSYHILMSDGYWNSDSASQATGNVDNSDGPTISGPTGNSFKYVPARPYRDSHSSTLADAAMYYWNRDLRPDLPNRVPPDSKNPAFWQHMVNFTVGLGVDGTLDFPNDFAALQSGAKNWPQPGNDRRENIDDLWHAAVNSRGEFLSAKNPDQFADSLSSILEEIVARNASEGGVAAAAATLQEGNRKYVPEYKTVAWTGDLKAYSLDSVGQQGELQWSAVEQLPPHESRNIVVGTRNGTPKAETFKWANMSATLRTELGAGANEALVNFLRGDESLEGSTYRNRETRMGDMVNSQPIFVQGLVDMQYNALPTSKSERSSYRGFVNTKKTRNGVIFIGGNDGMLHAFRASDGVETFAFIPRILVPGLSALASPSYGHRYYVDGQLTESDAYFGGGWKNVLVGSTGAGARSVFALDVTSNASMGAGNVLWEYDSTMDSGLGYVLTPIEVGLMRNGEWAAVFGNGVHSGAGAKLLIVNVSTGALIKQITVDATAENGLAGVRVIRSANREIVGAYAGDLEGKVWKFDLVSDNSNDWGVAFGAPLFDTGRPITAPPQYIVHPEGGYMVLVGTGKLYDDGDQSSTDSQYLYGLWDQQKLVEVSDEWQWTTNATTVSAGDIVDQTIDSETVSGAGGATYYTIDAEELDWSTDRGWRIPLTIISGHRNLLSPQLIFGFALFETMSPSAGGVVDGCDSTGSGAAYNLLINPLYGSMPGSPVFDTNGDGVINDEDDVVAGVKGVWDGRDVVLTERPCVTAEDCPDIDLCPDGTKLVSIQGAVSGNTNVCLPVPAPERWWWRQIQ